MKVGFIGTGHMGNPMARNLIAAGHELVVHDAFPQACANLIELGATWADSPKEVAEQCGVIFTSLPGPKQVDEVAMADNGILAGAAEGTIHVDLSSNSISAVKRLAGMCAAKGVGFLDAPVSGGTRGAEAGTLAVMVGGDAKTFEQVKPLLEIIGGNVFHLGENGTGTMLKLTNNILALGATVLLQEVVTLGTKAGIPIETLHKVWSAGSGAGQAAAIPRVFNKQFDNPFFSLELSAKDIGLCLEAARDLQVPMTVGSAIDQVYRRSMVKGYGNKSWFATLLTIEEEAGVVNPVWVEEKAP
jgi:3-hydroxyisobutyrate dehydrogenase-like beta-hydroxyacid dehydrogenase